MAIRLILRFVSDVCRQMQKRREYTAVLETGLGGRLDATNASAVRRYA